jgi:lipopolysaccharide transport system ATP-binding protein
MKRIELDDVHLMFTLRHRGGESIKDWALRKLLRRPPPPAIQVHALRGVSLQVADGERLGIIGHNGAGKSTLLRLLSGVYTPTSGTRTVHGRISSLFELSLGFEPDATGDENIRFRAYLQKQTPRVIASKVKEIAEFSELGDALKMPIRYYSSGMLVRLAFSIATAIEPEVLLVDEVLAAGDIQFQQRARARMRELMKHARAIVLVSHDLAALAEMCDRVLWLDKGQVRQIGPVLPTIAAYSTYMMELVAKKQAA